MVAASSLFAIISLAITVSAANFKRVACPDGVNTATNGDLSQICKKLFSNMSS
jgi:hypothetical protein